MADNQPPVMSQRAAAKYRCQLSLAHQAVSNWSRKLEVNVIATGFKLKVKHIVSERIRD